MRFLRFSVISYVLFLIGSFHTYAQQSNLDAYEKHFFAEEYIKAKEAIDKAILHSTTKNNALAWAHRGDIYMQLRILNKGSADNLFIAADSYNQALALNSEVTTLSLPVSSKYRQLANSMFIAGANRYNKKNFASAAPYFEYTERINAYFGIVDSLAIYNQALSYENSGNYEKALTSYQKSVDIGYRAKNAYYYMSLIYRNQGNDDAAIELLSKARELFPADPNLLTSQVNLFLKHGRFDEALSTLDIIIQNGNGTARTYFARGSVGDNLNKRSEAEKDYLTAIELDGQYFEAHYALGALYFNMGTDLNYQANEIDDPAAYSKTKAEADAQFVKAIPFLEKADMLNKNQPRVLQSLKELYIRTNNAEMYAKVREKLKALGY